MIYGQQLAYRRAGRGEPMVLVHGITTYSFIWESVIPFLQEHFEVYALDLLGCGESSMSLDSSYALGAHADRLSDFIETLQLDRPHLVGHDLGGGICQIVAAREALKLRTLSLLNTVAYDYWPVQPIKVMRTPVVRQLLMALTNRRVFKIMVKRGLYHQERLTDKLLESFYAPFSTSAGRKAFLHWTRCLDNRELTSIAQALRNLDLPTLILWGDADPYLSREIPPRLHREIPNSHLERIASASHYLMVDEPLWTAQQIKKFIQRTYAKDRA